MSGQSLPAGYFDDLYSAAEDPWSFDRRWYEQRKRAITLACLPRPRFRRAFEPGCSIGTLSEGLAARCDELLAADVSQRAVDAAGARLSGWPGAQVRRLSVPTEWPDGTFDLIVVSEIAYYYNETGARDLGSRAAASLAGDGVVVLCHWLHPVADYPMTGAAAQRAVREGSGLDVLLTHDEPDFTLQVLARPGTPSVAAAEGLLD